MLVKQVIATAFVIGALAVGLAGSFISSPRVEANGAPVIDPATLHFYEAVAVTGGITWTDANAAAQARSYLGCTGHLATITSAAENTFITTAFPLAAGSIGNFGEATTGYWLGGLNTGSLVFEWITGEAFSYTNWRVGEPNGDLSGAIHFDARNNSFGKWNDARINTFNNTPWKFPGYVVEYSCFDSITACKKDGWMGVKDAEGNQLFKNQGDCVAFIQTSGGNEPGQNIPTSQE